MWAFHVLMCGLSLDEQKWKLRKSRHLFNQVIYIRLSMVGHLMHPKLNPVMADRSPRSWSNKKFEIIFFSLKWKPYLEHCNFIYNFKVWFFLKTRHSSNGTRIHNHLVRKRTINHLAKLAKWLSCVVSTNLYGSFDCMILSCQVRVSEWIYILYFRHRVCFE